MDIKKGNMFLDGSDAVLIIPAGVVDQRGSFVNDFKQVTPYFPGLMFIAEIVAHKCSGGNYRLAFFTWCGRRFGIFQDHGLSGLNKDTTFLIESGAKLIQHVRCEPFTRFNMLMPGKHLASSRESTVQHIFGVCPPNLILWEYEKGTPYSG